MKKKVLVGAILLGFSMSAAAGSFKFNPQNVEVPAGGSLQFTVSYASASNDMNAGGSDNAELRITFDDTDLTITSEVLVPGVGCNVGGANGTINVVPPDGVGSALPTADTDYCRFTVVAASGATVGNRPITEDLVECSALGTILPSCTFAGMLAVGPAGADSAPTITIPTAPVSIGNGATVNITATATAGNGNDTSLVTEFNCAVPTGFNVTPNTGGPIHNGNVGTDFPVIMAATCTAGTSAVTANMACTITRSGDADVTVDVPLTCEATSSTGVDASFNPADGSAVTLPGGNAGDPTSTAITVTATGGASTDNVVVSSCSLSGTDASAFDISSNTFPLNVASGSNAPINVTSTVAAAAQTATLSCTFSDHDDTDTVVSWTLNIPAGGGGGTALPTLTMAPTCSTTVAFSGGAQGSTQNQSINVTASSTGTGNALLQNCAVTGTGFALTSGANYTLPAGGSATLNLTATLGSAALNGSLSCDVTEGTSTTPTTCTWPLTAPAGTTGPGPGPAPVLVPASSLWSKLAMFGVFAALGMLVLGLRRNH